MSRSEKVPKEIPDHNVWNDCWYDEKRKAFVTFNKYFEEANNARTRDIQIQYDKEMGNTNSGIVIEKEKVQFKFGYPVILQKDLKQRDAWFFLPTMTDDMLTEEIVLARIKPKSQNDAVLYETESEQWITVGTDGFQMCEKENEISDKLGLFASVPIDELKSLFGRK